MILQSNPDMTTPGFSAFLYPDPDGGSLPFIPQNPLIATFAVSADSRRSGQTRQPDF
jgi:hypothetical protein